MKTKIVPVRLDCKSLKEVKDYADILGIGISTLIKIWVKEKLIAKIKEKKH